MSHFINYDKEGNLGKTFSFISTLLKLYDTVYISINLKMY